MLKEKNCPKKFWGDVVVCVVYLMNRFPTKKKTIEDHTRRSMEPKETKS
jgi:hypothetical protein